MRETTCPEEVNVVPTEQTSRGAEVAPASPALARLIEEVRVEKAVGPYAYDRMHNRHNRSR